LGSAYFSLEQYELAVSEYERAFESMQETRDMREGLIQGYRNARYHFNRGRALAGLKRYPEAKNEFDLAIHGEEKFARAYFERATVLEELHDRENSTWDFRFACRLGHRGSCDWLTKHGMSK
jgi:tetratricopeptide (TPR) repeat protein